MRGEGEVKRQFVLLHNSPVAIAVVVGRDVEQKGAGIVVDVHLSKSKSFVNPPALPPRLPTERLSALPQTPPHARPSRAPAGF